ncbi:MAG: putative Ig domain-containing protein [Gemmataceae bacterium]
MPFYAIVQGRSEVAGYGNYQGGQYDTALTVAGSFTNAGVITLRGVGDPQPGGYARLTVLNNGTLTNTGKIDIEVGSSFGPRTLEAELNNSGIVNVSSPTPLGRAGANHINTGVINIVGTNLDVTGDSMTQRNGGTVTGGGTLNLNSLSLFGVGNLTVNVNVNSSQLNPGESPGRIDVTGSYGMSPDAALNIEIGGTVGGVSYDQLVVTGSASLAGTLNVSFVNGYTPGGTTDFEIIKYGSLSGTFASSNLPALPSSKHWEIEYGSESTILHLISLNSQPLLTSTPPTDADEGALYSYPITTADSDVGDTRTIVATTLPGWLTLLDNGDGSATLSGTPNKSDVGTHRVVLKVTDVAGEFVTQSFDITVEARPHVVLLACGADGGGRPDVRVYNADGTPRLEFVAYFSDFLGGVRVATGDIDGDSIDDIVTAPGPNGGPHIRIFSGADGALLDEFFAYDAAFAGGVFVALGDINNDGTLEIITGADAGGGPHVKVFDTKSHIEVRSFYAYDAHFTGGVRVASGDVNNDGFDDIITGAGPGGGPHVKTFDGASGELVHSFYAFESNFTGGVYVAAGDMNEDLKADIIVGAGRDYDPQVRVFNATDLTELMSFNAYELRFHVGVRVAIADVNGDGRPEIVTGAGTGGGPHFEAFDVSLSRLENFYAYDPTFLGGVFVA